MANRHSSQINWVSFYAFLALLALFSVAAMADHLQVNIFQAGPAGSEVNVSQNITFVLNISTETEADNLTNISTRVIYPAGFVWYVNSSVGINDTTDGLLVFERLYNAVDEVNITNGSSFIFNMTFRVMRNAKDFNFTFIVNGTNTTDSLGTVLTPFSNFTNSSLNMSSVAFFSNYSFFSTNFTSMLFNILGVTGDNPNSLGPLLAHYNGSINFTRPINLSYANLDVNTIIGTGFVAVNSSAFDPSVNYTAFVRIYNTTCPASQKPTVIVYNGDNITNVGDIYRSQGEDCRLSRACENITCETTGAGENVVTFTAMHFSAFASGANANLTVNTTSPGIRRGTGTGIAINFTANYTNSTLAEDINGSCEINLTQAYGATINANMSQLYSPDSGAQYFFNFTPNRTQIGLFSVNVTCDSPDFSRIFVNFTYNVSDNVAPQVVNVTPTENMTFNQTSVINLTANVLEDARGVGVDKVFVDVTYPNATVKRFSMTNPGGALYSYSFDETILAFGRYNLTIYSNDTEGNLNSTVNATFFVNDTLNPSVTNLSPNNKNISVGEMINISVNVTDNSTFQIGSGIVSVKVNITLPESIELIQITLADSVVTSNYYIGNFSNTTQSGRYNYTIEATDVYGNKNATQSAFFVQSASTSNSTIANSTIANSTVYNSTVIDSNVTNSVTNGSTIENGTINNATVLTSSVNRSTMSDSTAQNSTIEGSQVTDKSSVDGSLVDNSTVFGSIVNQSTSSNSTNVYSNLTNAIVNNSKVQNSTVSFSNVSESIINGSTIGNSNAYNSTAMFSNVTQSSVNNSNIENSTVDKSNLTNARINRSVVDPSTVINSSVSVDSTILDSWIENSSVVSGNLTNVTLNNSRLVGVTVLNSNISNTTSITNSRVENSTLHDITITNTPLINGEPNLPNVSTPAVDPNGGAQAVTYTIAVNVTDLSNVSAVLMNVSSLTNGTVTTLALTWNAGNEYRTTYTPPITAPTGPYVIWIDANDTVNNHNTTVNQTFTVNDSTPPNVTSLWSDIVIGNQSNSFNLTANITDNTNGSYIPVANVTFNITSPDGTYTVLPGVRQGATPAWSAVFITTSNQRWGNYTWVVDANDTVNNRNASANSSFIVNDVTAPWVLNASPNNVNISWGATINVSFNASDNSGGRNVSRALVNVTLPDTTLIVLDAVLAPGQNDIYIINFSNTTLVGQYNYTIDANDSSNNRNATVGAFFVQTQAPAVTSVTTDITFGNQSNSINMTATITHGDGVNVALFNVSNPNGAFVMSLLGVKQGASNTFAAVYNTTITDQTGNYSFVVDANSTFNMRNATMGSSFVINDVTAPNVTSIYSDIVLGNQTNSFNLSANITDNTNGSYVPVSTVLFNVSSPSGVYYSLIGVRQGNTPSFAAVFNTTEWYEHGNYTYLVDSNDTANNRNATVRSSFVVNDVFGPNVTGLSSDPVIGNQSNSYNLTATVFDTNASATSVSAVLFNVTSPDTTYTSLIGVRQGASNIWAAVFNTTSNQRWGNYTYVVDANDTLNNRNASVNSSFIVNDVTPPKVTNASPNNRNISWGEMINISVNVSDNSGGMNVSVVLINITMPDSQQVIVAAQPVPSVSFDLWIINFSNTTKAGRYNYTIDANDTNNNRNATVGAFFVQSAEVTNSSVTNATIANSTVDNSTVSSSNVSNAFLNKTTVEFSTVSNSTIISSFVNWSVIENSTATMSNLTGATVNQSLIENSTVYNTSVIISDVNASVTDNSTIFGSNVTRSNINSTLVENSTLFLSNLFRSIINRSYVDPSNVINSSVDAASTIEDSTIDNSMILNVTTMNATVNNSYVHNSTLMFGTNVSARSIVNNSHLDNSSVGFSNLSTVWAVESNMSQSRISLSSLATSNVSKMLVTNSSITQSTIRQDNINDPWGVDNSTLFNVRVSSGIPSVVFKMVSAQNLTISWANITCDLARGMPGAFSSAITPSTSPSDMRCTDFFNLTISGTGSDLFYNSSVNDTIGVDRAVVNNSAVSNVWLITNSTIKHSYVNYSGVNSSDVVSGSALLNANVSSSMIGNSSVVMSNVSGSWVLNSSTVNVSTVSLANVTNSTVTQSYVLGQGVATLVTNSSLFGSSIYNSTVQNTTAILSNITQSFVRNAFVDPSTIVNCTVDGWSNITDSRLENCTAIGSNVTNSTINSSRINGTGVYNSNVTNSSSLINVTRVENITLVNVTLQDVPLVTDVVSFLLFNTTTEATVNVTRNATFRIVVNNSMPYSITNLTVTVMYETNYLNYSLSSPQSLANASVSGTNYTAAIALGNVLSASLAPGKYTEVNFTFIALRNYSELPTMFNVTVIRVDGAVKQFNATLSQTLTLPLPSRADIVASGFAQVGTDQENLTTNLSLVPDASNVTGFQLGNQNGTVNWSFSTVNAVGSTGSSIPLIAAPNQGVIFMNGSVTFNTSAWHPSFNTSARITFFGVGCPAKNLVPIVNFSERLTSYSLIQGGGRDCVSVGACTNISCSGGANGNLSFTALHFTSFAASGNANLTVTSTGAVATSTAYVNASYVNASSGAFVSGATCNVSVLVGNVSMNYNMSEGVNIYSQPFTIVTAGTYIVNVTCNKPGYTTLNALDNITISPLPSPTGGGGWSGGGGGGYYRRPTNDTSSSTSSTTTVTTEKPTAQTAFDLLDLIKAFYKGVKDYTPFQIIDLIKRFYSRT